MHRLSGLDAMFLYLETQNTPMHVAGLSICEPPSGYEGHPYEEFRAQVVSRLHEVPSFTRRLEPTPLRLDHPVWVTAESIDLDYHIRRAALPRPGTWDQLRTMVEHLHTQLLDRKKPLWQFHVIEGLQGGRFAIYTKSHHACVDGGGGILAMDILSDREPKPREPLPVQEIRLPTRKPGFFEMVGHAYGSLIQQQFNAVKTVPAMVRTIRNVVRSAVKDGTWGLKDLKPAPHTIFNARVGKRRAYGTSSIPLGDIKALAKASGATLNDVVLAICAGALRKYLNKRHALPEQSLVAAVPVSMREVGDVNQANQVSSIFPRIHTEIADPLERLEAIKASMGRAKAQLKDIKDVVPRDFSVFGAPAIVPLVWQVVERTGIMESVPSFINVAISNVPGPRRPMYFAGIKVTEFYPVSIAAHGAALNITMQSYVDRLDFGLTACREACPDIQTLAGFIVEEFQALAGILMKREASRAAAKALKEAPEPAPKKSRAGRPGSGSQAKPTRVRKNGAAGQVEPASG